MKQIFLTIVALCMTCQAIQAQQKIADTNSLTLGRQWQQDYVQTIRGFVEENKKISCEEKISYIRQIMAKFIETTESEQKRELLRQIKYSCPLTISFLDSIVQNDTSEAVRRTAISCLSGLDAVTSIPFLLRHAKRSDISSREKAEVGSALIIMLDYQNGETILNQNCFSTDRKLCDICIWSYFMLGNESSKNYYRYIITHSNDSSIINCSAQRLAELGDSEMAFPVLEKMLQSNKEERKSGAIRGLQVIGDEKSIQLIKKMQRDIDPVVRKRARNTLEEMDIKTDEVNE